MTFRKLRHPSVFKDVGVAMCAVGKSLVMDHRDSSLIISAVDGNLRFQLWATISENFMFDEVQFDSLDDERAPIELRTDSLVKSLRNYSPVEDIRMEVQEGPEDSRILVMSSETLNYEGSLDTRVEQKIPARKLNEHELLEEPDVPGIKLWGEPTTRQLQQMARVSEQYRSMGVHINISLSSLGELTLSAKSAEAEALATWQVRLVEVVHTDTPESLPSHPQQQQQQQQPATCLVDTRDWVSVLQSRQVMQRFIVGIAHHGGVAIHGYLQSGSQDDCLSFYLSPVHTAGLSD